MSAQSTTSPVAKQSVEDTREPRQLSLADLDGKHRELLVRAITRILSTEVAEITYAQIIDGLSTGDVAYDARNEPYSSLDHGGVHPIDHAHDELCPGMLEKTREFRDKFQPEILTFSSKLLHGYCACAPGSRGFKTRLIEMVAVAVHQIAAILFELDTSVHKKDGITEWAPLKSDPNHWRWYPDGPLPSLFHHDWYNYYDQYPRGVADMVGYWAESRILGGVVLFDRRDPDAQPAADPDPDLTGFDTGPTVDPDAIYLHPDRYQVTYRICQLLPEQREALLSFLLADDPPSDHPLPIVPNQNNRVRVDPEEPIRDTGIYRDLWERKDIPPSRGDSRLRDVISQLDYPDIEDHFASKHRAMDRLQRKEYEDAWSGEDPDWPETHF